MVVRKRRREGKVMRKGEVGFLSLQIGVDAAIKLYMEERMGSIKIMNLVELFLMVVYLTCCSCDDGVVVSQMDMDVSRHCHRVQIKFKHDKNIAFYDYDLKIELKLFV
ncbi:uncharacterized protein LOC125368629 isoform X1 [Ricinus communis]|uniref:uncharacterized protein LOC125368629 isoform X1 n=1 Tax=Ricinus communis TaxID=3988 RepID=UPI00201ABF01|nr:uncharacterized protein LOC125368629 isoform X1 [Ricinus communis]